MVASEATPWAKTGGLADVVGALPAALEELGHAITLVLPRYRGVDTAGAVVARRSLQMGRASYDLALHVLEISARRRVVFVEHPFFERDGLYGSQGRDYADNALRFGLLARAVLDFAESEPAAPPDVIHVHDWQAGLVPTWLRAEPRRWPRLSRAGLVFTIHNLAYQGLFPKEMIPSLGLPWEVFTLSGGEFWNQLSFLKAGINFSDWVTTVSPAYARETLTAEFGAGMEGVLAARGERYVGILNGIDAEIWNPASDRWLPAPYSAAALSGKARCKLALLERFGLPVGDDARRRPVVGLVSRLVDQKGLDLVAAASASLLNLDATWVFVGAGEPKYEQFLRDLATRHPSRVGVFVGFSEELAHLVEAGADIFLMPSRFEPCGLNQMYSLRYGTVPVVHAVGGLDDTVQPYTARARRANGFKFRDATPEALVRAVRQAVRLFHDKGAWSRLIRTGMSADYSWRKSAREYVKVYRRARAASALRGGQPGPTNAKG